MARRKVVDAKRRRIDVPVSEVLFSKVVEFSLSLQVTVADAARRLMEIGIERRQQ